MSPIKSHATRGAAVATTLGALALVATACAGGAPAAGHKATTSKPTNTTSKPKLSSTPTPPTKPSKPTKPTHPTQPSTPGHLAPGQYANARAGLPHWAMALFPLSNGFGGTFSFVYQDGRTSTGSTAYTVSTQPNGQLTLTFVGDAVYHGTYSAGTVNLPGCSSYLSGVGSSGTTPVVSCSFHFAGAAPASWTDPYLVISPQGLGDVHIGTTMAQAQSAAEETFDATGDGFAYHSTVASNYPRLWVGPDSANVVTCVGAGMTNTLPFNQTVVTPEGFMLGDGVAYLLNVYGNRAKYVPSPANGLNPVAGYVVAEGSGRLAFWVDNGGAVLGVAAGGPGLEPSTCNG